MQQATPSPTTRTPAGGLSLAAVRQLQDQLVISEAECWSTARQRERQAGQLQRVGALLQAERAENRRLRALLGMAKASA